MQISAVRLHKVTNPSEQKLKATVSVVFDEQFVVHDLRVVQGVNGLFVAMPRRKNAQGEYKDMAHPITAGAREMIQKAILEAYGEMEAKETLVEAKDAVVEDQVAEPVSSVAEAEAEDTVSA